MSEPGRDKTKDIVRAARGLSPEAQDSFLKQACEGDAALRREVDSLLGATVVPGVESAIRTHPGQLSSPDAAGRAGEVAAPRQARYVFKGEVGRGGMGAVLKVFDTDLRRNLAMKVILGQEERTEGGTPSVPSELVDRFLEEAQVTGQLEHPGVVVHQQDVELAQLEQVGRPVQLVQELIERHGQEGHLILALHVQPQPDLAVPDAVDFLDESVDRTSQAEAEQGPAEDRECGDRRAEVAHVVQEPIAPRLHIRFVDEHRDSKARLGEEACGGYDFVPAQVGDGRDPLLATRERDGSPPGRFQR